MSIGKLEHAIRDLEGVLQELIGLLEESGWPASLELERLAEETREVDVVAELATLHTVTTPERAPVPAKAGALYQRWFSGASAIINKNQPTRAREFNELHERASDLFTRTHMTQTQQFSATRALRQQSNILNAVPDHIRFSALDLELEAYATLMDDEIGAARTLAERGFLRPAGAFARVILERHLKNLLRKHEPPISFRPNSTLSTLNDLCKDAIYDQPVWRRVQHLTDLRNICAHEKDREPTKDEVAELLLGVSGIIKSTPRSA